MTLSRRWERWTTYPPPEGSRRIVAAAVVVLLIGGFTPARLPREPGGQEPVGRPGAWTFRSPARRVRGSREDLRDGGGEKREANSALQGGGATGDIAGRAAALILAAREKPSMPARFSPNRARGEGRVAASAELDAARLLPQGKRPKRSTA
jgi:hypothetical protein